MSAADQPSTQRIAATDDADLALAARELEAAREMLREAHAIPDRHERDESIRVACGRLGLASRAIDTVVDRREGPSTPKKKGTRRVSKKKKPDDTKQAATAAPQPELEQAPTEAQASDVCICDVSVADENGDFPPCAE